MLIKHSDGCSEAKCTPVSMLIVLASEDVSLLSTDTHTHSLINPSQRDPGYKGASCFM